MYLPIIVHNFKFSVETSILLYTLLAPIIEPFPLAAPVSQNLQNCHLIPKNSSFENPSSREHSRLPKRASSQLADSCSYRDSLSDPPLSLISLSFSSFRSLFLVRLPRAICAILSPPPLFYILSPAGARSARTSSALPYSSSIHAASTCPISSPRWRSGC